MQRSGITAVIRNYLTHFDWNNIQVDLLVDDSSEEELVEQMRQLGANVYFMPGLSGKNVLSFLNFIKQFFTEHHYDIVHSHYYQLDTMVFPIAKRACKCKCISHSHSTRYSEYKLRSVRNWLISRGIGKSADVWAACSNEAGEFLFGRGYRKSPKKLIVINGIECKDYAFNESTRAQKRQEFGIGDDEIIVGHIGRMAPPKNPLFVIDIFAELLRINNRYRLMLVGDGPMEEEIREKANGLGISDKIYYAGVRSDVPQLINAFDVFLFPSLYEGLGIVAVEAQANGLSCVVSDAVPTEVDLTGIAMLSIKKSPSIWAQAVDNTSKKRQLDKYKMVVDAGYNIQSAADSLMDYYCRLVK